MALKPGDPVVLHLERDGELDSGEMNLVVGARIVSDGLVYRLDQGDFNEVELS
jgi:hypothetical protein